MSQFERMLAWMRDSLQSGKRLDDTVIRLKPELAGQECRN